MNEIQIFNNEEFGQVRTIEIDGEPWFLGTDIANALQYSDKNKAVSMHVEDEDKKTLFYKASDKSSEALWSKTNDFSDKVLINESGLYSMIMSSKLPSAKKFKHWVTSEVLPEIRKTGGYQMPKTYAEALRALADRAEEAERLAIANKEMKPKAEYFDELVNRNLLTNFRDTAKELGIKEKNFIRFLETKRFIYRDAWGKIRPYAERNKGLFELKEFNAHYSDHTGVQTLITPKGRETFRLLLKELKPR